MYKKSSSGLNAIAAAPDPSGRSPVTSCQVLPPIGNSADLLRIDLIGIKKLFIMRAERIELFIEESVEFFVLKVADLSA